MHSAITIPLIRQTLVLCGYVGLFVLLATVPLVWLGLGEKTSSPRMKRKKRTDNKARLIRWKLLSLMLPVTLVFLAGCTVPMAQVQPPVDLPQQFSESGSQQLPEQWWRMWNDPMLDDLINQALSGNLSLQAAWDRLDQAQATARKAGAALQPSLNAEADASHQRQRENGVGSIENEFSLGLAASYEVDLWGKLRASQQAAAYSAQASAEDLQTAAISLSAEVASTWYQLVEKDGQIEILQEQITTNKQILDLVTLQFRTGQVAIADVLQQRQLIVSNQGELAQVLAQRDVLRHQLAVLLGVAPGELTLQRVTVIHDLPELPETGLTADLVRRRPDLRSAYASVLAADRDVAVAVADQFPQLTLSAQLTTNGDQVSRLFDNWLASLAGNLVAPVLDGGERKAEVERTRAAASEALNDYGQAVLTALQEVEDALVNEQRQREYLQSLDRQLELANQVLEQVRERYLKGTEDYQRVLDALISSQSLQQSQLTAKLELVEYRIELCRALGGGWKMEKPERLAHQ